MCAPSCCRDTRFASRTGSRSTIARRATPVDSTGVDSARIAGHASPAARIRMVKRISSESPSAASMIRPASHRTWSCGPRTRCHGIHPGRMLSVSKGTHLRSDRSTRVLRVWIHDQRARTARSRAQGERLQERVGVRQVGFGLLGEFAGDGLAGASVGGGDGHTPDTIVSKFH